MWHGISVEDDIIYKIYKISRSRRFEGRGCVVGLMGLMEVRWRCGGGAVGVVMGGFGGLKCVVSVWRREKVRLEKLRIQK